MLHPALSSLNSTLICDLPVKFAGINFGSYGERWLPIGYTFAACLIKGDSLASLAGT
jgi:hypothetical protein